MSEATRSKARVPTGSVEPLSLDEMATWRAFIMLTRRVLDRLDHELQASHGLTLPDYEVLVALSESPERQMQMTELAERSLVSQSRLTYRVDRLERDGYVERIPCEADGRRIWARLTRDGFRKLEQAYPVHLAGARKYVIDPPSRTDLAAVGRAARAMLAALDE